MSSEINKKDINDFQWRIASKLVFMKSVIKDYYDERKDILEAMKTGKASHAELDEIENEINLKKIQFDDYLDVYQDLITYLKLDYISYEDFYKKYERRVRHEK